MRTLQEVDSERADAYREFQALKQRLRALALLLLASCATQSNAWHPATVAKRERIMDLRMKGESVVKMVSLRNPYPRPIVALVECTDGVREMVVDADDAEAWIVFADRDRVWEDNCRLCGWEFLEH